MGFETNHNTITTGANFIPEIWADLVIKATESNLVMWKTLWDWSEATSKKGDTIHVPSISDFSTNPKSASAQVTLNAVTEGKTDLSIDTHRECSFLIEDILAVQSSYNLTKYYTEKSGYAIAKQMDTAANALVAGFSQIVGAAGTDIGDVQVRDAIELLDLADVPMDERNFLIHPTQKNALFGIEKYFKAYQRGDGASAILTKGKFGEIYGMNVDVSTNVGTNGGARLNAIYHREAIACAKQSGPRTQTDYILEYLGTLNVTDVIYGLVEARDTFGVWLKS